MNHVISLGGGVQSSTMALMAARGELRPMPEFAIFADTLAEPASVYRWLDWLEKQLPFPVYRVSKGNLFTEAFQMRTTDDGRKFARINLPVHTRNENGSAGRVTHRNCTIDYKIQPIIKELRDRLRVRRGEKHVRVIQWLGISLDEVSRMKDAKEPWIQNRWPLTEAGMRRSDCLVWMKNNGFPEPPRSSCVFCPFHNNHEWRRLRNDEPVEFQRAIDFELELQKAKQSENFNSMPYLHRSLVPLGSVDLSTAEERGQLNLFENECEGVCGV